MRVSRIVWKVCVGGGGGEKVGTEWHGGAAEWMHTARKEEEGGLCTFFKT